MVYKSFLIYLLFFIINGAAAQEYKKFKVGLGLGRNLIHTNSGSLYIEPTYLIKNNLSVGFRFELSTTIVNVTSTSNTQGTLFTSHLISYSLEGKRYILEN